MARLKRVVVLACAGSAAVALAACGGGTGASSNDSNSKGGAAKSIKLVAAEYSASNTKAFWDKFATEYKKKTGTTLDVQVVSWTDIDQQSSTMIQNGNPPDILYLFVYASYSKDGLLYVSDEDGGRDIYVARLSPSAAPEGSAVRLTTGLHPHTISLSADGRRLLYSLYTETSNIWAVDLQPGR